MSTLGSMALSAGEVAFFAPPPRPPQRRAGRSVGAGGIGRLIRLVRRELAGATRHSPVQSIPPLRNYPYRHLPEGEPA